MGLYPRSTDVEYVDRDFPRAQAVRELLASWGFVPLCRLGDGEHWVRGGRRVVLQYEGEEPSKAKPKDLLYATIVPMGGEWGLSFD